jgi:hypothetical protein
MRPPKVQSSLTAGSRSARGQVGEGAREPLQVLEVVPGLRVDVAALLDAMGDDVAESFLHAGLTIIELAVAEARRTPWWNGLPGRIHRTLGEQCARGLRMVELGARMQEAQTDYLYALTHPRVDQELLLEARRRANGSSR